MEIIQEKEDQKKEVRQNAAFPFVFVTQRKNFVGKMEMQQQVNPGMTERLYIASKIFSTAIAKTGITDEKLNKLAEYSLHAADILLQKNAELA